MKKQYQTNSEWERDRNYILQSINSFDYEKKFTSNFNHNNLKRG